MQAFHVRKRFFGLVSNGDLPIVPLAKQDCGCNLTSEHFSKRCFDVPQFNSVSAQLYLTIVSTKVYKLALSYTDQIAAAIITTAITFNKWARAGFQVGTLEKLAARLAAIRLRRLLSGWP